MGEIEKQEQKVVNEDIATNHDKEIPVVELDYSKYQVVRGEYFAHIREPSVTFKNNKISFNTACIKKLPDADYVLVLVNSEDRKLIVRPSSEDVKDAFVWCSRGRKRGPKQTSCEVFFAKIMDLTGWNLDYRYKLLGRLVRSEGELVLAFDLNSVETYPCISIGNEKPKISRTPVYPQEWQAAFGLSFEEHRKRLQVDIFKGYTVFSVKEKNSAETTEQ